MKAAIQECVNSEKYADFNFDNDIFAPRLKDNEVWDLMQRIIKSAGPILLLIRLGDLKAGTLSKLRGTTNYLRTLFVETGDGSLEDKIAECFHERVASIESDVANCAYMIDPQFVAQSRDAPADLMRSFWKVAKKILGHDWTDDQWMPLRTTIAAKLQAFRMKADGFANENYAM